LEELRQVADEMLDRFPIAHLRARPPPQPRPLDGGEVLGRVASFASEPFVGKVGMDVGHGSLCSGARHSSIRISSRRGGATGRGGFGDGVDERCPSGGITVLPTSRMRLRPASVSPETIRSAVPTTPRVLRMASSPTRLPRSLSSRRSPKRWKGVPCRSGSREYLEFRNSM